MENTYKSVLRALIRKREAKKVSRLLRGNGYVTHVKHVSTDPIGDTDHFEVVVYHKDLKEKVNNILGYTIDDWKDERKS